MDLRNRCGCGKDTTLQREQLQTGFNLIVCGWVDSVLYLLYSAVILLFKHECIGYLLLIYIIFGGDILITTLVPERPDHYELSPL